MLIYGQSFCAARPVPKHALIDGLGRLVAFLVTPGQRGHAPFAADLIQAVPVSAAWRPDTTNSPAPMPLPWL